MSADRTEKNNRFAREKYKLNLETPAYFWGKRFESKQTKNLKKPSFSYQIV